MKIAIDTSSVAGTKIGGLGFYIRQLLEAWQSMDRTNHYVVFMPAIHRDLFPVNAPNFNVVVIPRWMNRPVGNIVWYFFILPFVLMWHAVDVYHLPDFRRALLWAPCRIVTSAHDLINYKSKRQLGFFRRWYNKFVFKKMIRQAEDFITVSNNTRNDMLEAGFPSEKIHVIHNGVSPDFKPRPREEARRVLAARNLAANYVLCVSRLEHPQKNHVTLLRAWARLVADKNFKHQLVLVGEKFWNHQQVFAEMDRLGIRDRILYCDYVTFAELLNFYNAADCFVFPSLYEGFGLPVLEGMASGVPVVASESSSIVEVAGGAALLFPPLDDAALATQIKSVLENPSVARDLIEKGAARAAQFTWQKSAAAHLDVFLGRKTQ